MQTILETNYLIKSKVPRTIHADRVSTKSKVPRPALRDTSEVIAIFGYECTDSLDHAIATGLFPKADVLIIKTNTGYRKRYWTITVINNELKKRKLKSM